MPIRTPSQETVTLICGANDCPSVWIAAIQRANRCYLNPEITPERFPKIQAAPWQTNLTLLPFDPRKGSPLSILGERGLSRPTYEHALCFAATYPKFQRKILFFHEPIHLPHLLHWGGLVTAIIYENECRYICLPPTDFDWGEDLLLPGI